jgi:hypothetical protein
MSNQKYYFWLLGWNYERTPRPLFTVYILCEVDQNGFTIHDSKAPIAIKWDQVSNLDLYSEYVSHFGLQYAVEIFINVDTRVKKMYLIATNTMNTVYRHHIQENETLVKVMNIFRNHGSIAIHPNPYYRAFERAEKPDYFLLQNWDPTVSPKEYRKCPAIKNAILRSQKRGFLWAYWITTGFVAFILFLILRQSGNNDVLFVIVTLGGMWLLLTAIVSWFVFSANRDLSK